MTWYHEVSIHLSVWHGWPCVPRHRSQQIFKDHTLGLRLWLDLA